MSTANTEIGEVATKSRDWKRTVKGSQPDTDEVATIADVPSSGYDAIKPWLDSALALAMLVITAPIILICMVADEVDFSWPLDLLPEAARSRGNDLHNLQDSDHV